MNDRLPSHPVAHLGGFLLLLLALTPTHTKIAGLLWLLACLIAAVIAWRSPVLASDESVRGARRWLMACLATLVLWQSMAMYWEEPCCDHSSDLNAAWRWTLGAWAGYLLVRRWRGDLALGAVIHHALAAACLASLALVLMVGRLDLPSYPIPWSASVGMLIMLLFPVALQTAHGNWMRRWWLTACAAGVAAVLLSQSRGAYIILGWMVYLWARAARPVLGWQQSMLPLAWAASLMAAIALSGLLPSDPLRMREGWNDIAASWRMADYNTSLGGRFALYRMASDTVSESPLLGVGARERLSRIRSLGLDRPEPERSLLAHARKQGHVHNSYKHHALYGGQISLVGFVLTIAGLLYAARALQNAHQVAALQLQGLAFVHGLTALSNVNHAHNYYVVMLSLSVLLAFVLIRCKSAHD
ncbi:MAG: O-antigen ligase family protein [Limnohabitans sp.]